MKSIPLLLRRSLSILLALSCLLLFLTGAAGAGSPPPFSGHDRAILILNSYHPGFHWSDNEQDAIVDWLDRRGITANPSIKYMDARNYPGPDQLTVVWKSLYRRYQGKKLDLVIALDDPALSFAVKHHAELFGTTPIVFCGVSNFTPALLAGDKRVTGIVSAADPIGAIEIMLRLHPQAKEIFVLHDYTQAGLAIYKDYEALFPRFTGRIRFRQNDNLPLPDILRQLGTLPRDSLVLLLSYANDATGSSFDVPKLTELFSRHCPVPIYGHADVRLGHGIVGGKLLSSTVVAEEAIKLIARIMHGEQVSNIPVVTKLVSQYLFDGRQMERFHIPYALLPPGSVVINRPVSFYEANKILVWATVTTLLLLMLVIGLLLFNIAQRRRAAIVLQDSEKRFRGLLENIGLAAVILDSEGRIAFCNDYLLRLAGWTQDEVLHQDWFELFIPAGVRSEVKSVFQAILGADSPVRQYENSIMTRRGMLRQIVWHNVALHTKDGKDAGIAGIGIDVTEHRQMEASLHRAEKMEALGLLAGGVAHDLNNVLGVTMAYAELLCEQAAAESHQKKYADSILAATEKAAAIIQDLLTLTRRGVTASQLLDLNRIVAAVSTSPEVKKLQDLQPSLTFKTDCDGDLLPITGSPMHLEKTLFNLLANAAEALRGGGEVAIRTENRYLDQPVRGYDQVREGEYAVLTVSDTGQGIAAGDLNRIFEPFYTKKSMGRSGTGLGLAIVWGTVKDHEGYIDVRSEEGKGTTFTLYFPVTRGQIAGESVPIPVAAYQGRGESVLVVDDVAEQRQVAVTILTRLGYQVQAVAGGEAAVEYLRSNPADIVVLDMIMEPGIDGLETYRRIKAFRPQQKAIIVSGFAETDRVREVQKLGAGAYVRKPYLREKIGLAIRRELEGT